MITRSTLMAASEAAGELDETTEVLATTHIHHCTAAHIHVKYSLK